jgi:glycosyltransferase involved in cell wall biosynthesis
MRKVVYFTDSANYGGAEQALLHLLSGLDQQRWQPLLLHHDEPGLAPLLTQTQALGIECRVVRRMPLGRGGTQLISGFARQLRHWQADVFHAHLIWPLACKYGLIGAMLAGVPVVVATSHLFVELPYSYATRIQQWVLVSRMGRLISVSNQLAQQWRQAFHIPQRKLAVIHNSVPAERFQGLPDAQLRAAWTGGSHRPVVLTIARLDRQKGHTFLLQAAARLPEVVFVFAGEGAERAHLEQEAASLGIAERVHFLGFRPDAPNLLANCDLFVLPSLFEGLPLSILEAMAAGKPVIATAVGGASEAICDGETGLLVAPADPSALATAIGGLLAKPEQAQRLSMAGAAAVKQNFSVDSMVRRTTAIYEECRGDRI